MSKSEMVKSILVAMAKRIIADAEDPKARTEIMLNRAEQIVRLAKDELEALKP